MDTQENKYHRFIAIEVLGLQRRKPEDLAGLGAYDTILTVVVSDYTQPTDVQSDLNNQVAKRFLIDSKRSQDFRDTAVAVRQGLEIALNDWLEIHLRKVVDDGVVE